MSLNNFSPKVWSARLLFNLNRVQVYTQQGVINRDYEGEISQAGDSVKINSIGRVTVGQYTKNTNIGDPETLDDAGQMLKITQSDFFNFAIDDVDKVQANVKLMDAAMQEAGWGLRDSADSFVASLYTDIAAANYIGSDGAPVTPDKTTAYEKLVDLKTLLDGNNVPTDGRWCIIPPWYEGLLLKDDRFVHATQLGDTVLRNGQVGRAAGFDLLSSNNVPNIGGIKYKVIAGHPVAWSYADQITEVEGYRPQQRFGDAMKGLHLYGAKVTRPNALAVLVASPS